MRNEAVLETDKKDEIIFISEAHKNFYFEKLEEVRYQDVYHKALIYYCET